MTTMTPLSRIASTCAILSLAVLSCAVVFNGALMYGMGMGTYDSEAYARFAEVVEVIFWSSLLLVPGVFIGSLTAWWAGWGPRAYVALGVLAAVPPLPFAMATTML